MSKLTPYVLEKNAGSNSNHIVASKEPCSHEGCTDNSVMRVQPDVGDTHKMYYFCSAHGHKYLAEVWIPKYCNNKPLRISPEWG